MNSPEADGPVMPVVIRDASGSYLGAAITNEKGYRKSIERSEAWFLDGVTGRLLPAQGMTGYTAISKDQGVCIVEAESWDASKASVGKSLPENSTAKAPGKVSPADAAFIFELQDLIYFRKEQMPEGSYTTHLFEKGEEKIRKKTGEEAVELILAGSNAELASEAADLLYHMMVLFAQRGMAINDVLDVLKDRH